MSVTKKTWYTPELGRKVASGARLKRPGYYHIISNMQNGWSIIAEGGIRAYKKFKDQDMAIKFIKPTAIQITVHTKEGVVDRVVKGDKTYED